MVRSAPMSNCMESYGVLHSEVMNFQLEPPLKCVHTVRRHRCCPANVGEGDPFFFGGGVSVCILAPHKRIRKKMSCTDDGMI